MSKTKKHHINPAMHYTVVIALIISLITTFLLGLLLTDQLWGGGLGYFRSLDHNARLERDRQMFIQSIQQQINSQLDTQRAQAIIEVSAPSMVEISSQ